MSLRSCRGFVLLPVMIALSLVAGAALTANRASALQASLTARSFDADAARYIAEAGLTQMEWELQKKNCTGYVDLASVPLAGHRFDASASRNAGQPVNLQAVSTTASGGSGKLNRADVRIFGTTQYQATIQAPDASGVDTYVDASRPDYNYGSLNEIFVEGGLYNGLLQFDLSEIPVGSRVLAATVWLYQTNGQKKSLLPAAIAVHAVRRSWVEGTQKGATAVAGASYLTGNGVAPWNEPGGDYDSVAAAQAAHVDGTGWRSWDISALTQDWIDGSRANYGLALVASSAVGKTSFLSSDDTTTPAAYPKLTVTFRIPCGSSGPAVYMRPIGASKDAGIGAKKTNVNWGASQSLLLNDSEKTRALWHFDVSDIAAGAKIQSAKLRLYVPSLTKRGGSSMTLNLHALLAFWTEGKGTGNSNDPVTWSERTMGVPWQTAGGQFRSQAALALTLPSTFTAPAWIEFDVRALAQEWVDGITPNHGVIVLPTTNDDIYVNTRDAVSNRPQLVVTY